MMVSTKGRYALRVMLDLAQQPPGEYAALSGVAERQGISVKYLEAIVATLCRAGLLISQRGKNGGYRLAREPGAYTAGSILRLTEGSLAPVNCLACGKNDCGRAAACLTLPMWTELDRRIGEYLESVTLEDLLQGRSRV